MPIRCYLTTSDDRWAEAFIEDDSMPASMQSWADLQAVACGLPVGAFRPVVVADGQPEPHTGDLIGEIDREHVAALEVQVQTLQQALPMEARRV